MMNVDLYFKKGKMTIYLKLSIWCQKKIKESTKYSYFRRDAEEELSFENSKIFLNAQVDLIINTLGNNRVSGLLVD